MVRYSIEPRARTFVKVYEFLAKNIGKNLGKNLSGKCSEKILHHAKNSGTYGIKTVSKRAIKRHRKRQAIELVIKLLTL